MLLSLRNLWTWCAITAFAALLCLGTPTLAAQAQTPPPAPVQAPEIAEPFGISDPREIEFPEFPWGWIAAGGAICVILGLLALWLLKRKPPVITQSHYADQALARLAELAKQAPEMDSYHFSIAVDDVLRDFLSRALSIRAENQTSQEFLRALNYYGGLRESLYPVIEQFLEVSDAFKFARVPGGAAENEQLVNRAREVIEGSRK